MRIKGLDGREYPWTPTGRYGKRNPNASKHHIAARELLQAIFPSYTVVEEVHLPGAGQTLYCDFYVCRLNIVVEVQGEQHYEFVPMFHKDMEGFKRSLERDRNKKAWCELNQIHCIELPHWENLDEWKQRIINLHC